MGRRRMRLPPTAQPTAQGIARMARRAAAPLVPVSPGCRTPPTRTPRQPSRSTPRDFSSRRRRCQARRPPAIASEARRARAKRPLTLALRALPTAKRRERAPTTARTPRRMARRTSARMLAHLAPTATAPPAANRPAMVQRVATPSTNARRIKEVGERQRPLEPAPQRPRPAARPRRRPLHSPPPAERRRRAHRAATRRRFPWAPRPRTPLSRANRRATRPQRWAERRRSRRRPATPSRRSFKWRVA